MVRARTPSGGELTIHDDDTYRVQTLCSVARARRYLEKVCFVFEAYVMDTRVLERKTWSEVLIIRDIPDVFPEDLAGCLLRGR